MTGPQPPSLHYSPVCNAVLPPLLCFAIRKKFTVDLRRAQLYHDSLVVKKLWMVISLMVSYFSWSALFYKCMVLLLIHACHSGELVTTQDNTNLKLSLDLMLCACCFFLLGGDFPGWGMAGKGEAGSGGTGHSWGPAAIKNGGCR